jgi:hypothetical protein
MALAPPSASAPRTGSVLLAAKLIAGHDAEGEQREPGHDGPDAAGVLDLGPGPEMGTSPGSSSGSEPGRRPDPGTPRRSWSPRPRPPGRRRMRPPGASIFIFRHHAELRGRSRRTHAYPPMRVVWLFLPDLVPSAEWLICASPAMGLMRCQALPLRFRGPRARSTLPRSAVVHCGKMRQSGAGEGPSVLLPGILRRGLPQRGACPSSDARLDGEHVHGIGAVAGVEDLGLAVGGLDRDVVT